MIESASLLLDNLGSQCCVLEHAIDELRDRLVAFFVHEDAGAVIALAKRRSR